MGCNCGKKSSGQQKKPPTQYALVAPDGTTTTFGSRLEADAAYVRAGKQGRVVAF